MSTLVDIFDGEYNEKKRKKLKEDITKGIQYVLPKLREHQNPLKRSFLEDEFLKEKAEEAEGITKREVELGVKYLESNQGEKLLYKRGKKLTKEIRRGVRTHDWEGRPRRELLVYSLMGAGLFGGPIGLVAGLTLGFYNPLYFLVSPPIGALIGGSLPLAGKSTFYKLEDTEVD